MVFPRSMYVLYKTNHFQYNSQRILSWLIPLLLRKQNKVNFFMKVDGINPSSQLLLYANIHYFVENLKFTF